MNKRMLRGHEIHGTGRFVKVSRGINMKRVGSGKVVRKVISK
jgi:hypothetical protein